MKETSCLCGACLVEDRCDVEAYGGWYTPRWKRRFYDHAIEVILVVFLKKQASWCFECPNYVVSVRIRSSLVAWATTSSISGCSVNLSRVPTWDRVFWASKPWSTPEGSNHQNSTVVVCFHRKKNVLMSIIDNFQRKACCLIQRKASCLIQWPVCDI